MFPCEYCEKKKEKKINIIITKENNLMFFLYKSKDFFFLPKTKNVIIHFSVCMKRINRFTTKFGQSSILKCSNNKTGGVVG